MPNSPTFDRPRLFRDLMSGSFADKMDAVTAVADLAESHGFPATATRLRHQQHRALSEMLAVAEGAEAVLTGIPIQTEEPPHFVHKFVVVEGIDGVGKTTQTMAIADYFRTCGDDVLVTREPGGTPLGERIREIVLGPATNLHPAARIGLFAADSAQHYQDVIRPALRAGKTVVCDRWLPSSWAYTWALSPELVSLAGAFGYQAARWEVRPVVFVLDCPPDEAAKRAEGTDFYERKGPEFFNRVREGYAGWAARYARQARAFRIDATQPADAVTKAITTRLDAIYAEGAW